MPNYVSQITLPNGVTYKIKDATAWEQLLNQEFRKQIVTVLPDPNAMTAEQIAAALHTIYLKPSADPNNAGQNIYDEYLLLQDTSTTPTSYSWELIGTTGTNLTNFSEKGHTHEVTPQTQVADHTFTVTGDTPVPGFTGTQGTVNATGTVTDGSVTVNVNPASGTGTSYTPQGSIGGTTESESNHTHPMGATTKYLEKTTIYGVNPSGTSVQPAPTTSSVIEGVAQVAESPLRIPKYTVTSGSVTVNPSTGSRADGTLTDHVSGNEANAVFNDAVVNSETETLSFVRKDLATAQTVTGIASASTTAKNVASSESFDFYPCKDGRGVPVHDYTYGAAVSAATVGSGVDVFTDVKNNSSATASQPVVTAVDANTGHGSAHSHSLGSAATFAGTEKKFSGTIANGSVSVSGSFTPQGTIAFPEGEGTFESDPITLHHRVSNPTVTTAPDVFDEESRLLDWYGVEWKVSSSDPHKTRIGNMDMHRSLPIQTAMRRCIVKPSGEVYNYLDQYDSRYYAPGSKDDLGTDIGGTASAIDGSIGHVMVEIPRHWRKVEQVTRSDGDYIRVLLSPYEQTGWKGVPLCYIGAYEAYATDVLCSCSGVAPSTGFTLSGFRNAARANKANSTDWNIMTAMKWFELYWLYVVEYANTDIREAYNPQLTPLGFRQGGLGSFSISASTTGNSNALGNRTYADATEGIRTYRGIESIWGHLGSLVDGILFDGSTAKGQKTLNLLAQQARYSSLSTSAPSSSGYISAVEVSGATGMNGAVVPTAVAGGSSTYYCGYFTYASGTRCVVLRGLMDIDTSNAFDFAGAATVGARLTLNTGTTE